MINPESNITPEMKDLNSLADQLDELQSQENEGRGVSCLKSVVADLRAGDLDNAKRVCFHDHDKIASYPRVKEFIINNLFASGQEHPWSVLERWQKSKK